MLEFPTVEKYWALHLNMKLDWKYSTIPDVYLLDVILSENIEIGFERIIIDKNDEKA